MSIAKVYDDGLQKQPFMPFIRSKEPAFWIYCFDDGRGRTEMAFTKKEVQSIVFLRDLVSKMGSLPFAKKGDQDTLRTI